MTLTTMGWLLGLVTSLVAALMVVPLGLALALDEPWMPFGVPAGIGALLGLVLLTTMRTRDRALDHRSAFLVVSLSWILACCVGALPYTLSDVGYLAPIDALFESVAGFTTTGATVLSGLDALPRSLLLWRALTQWIGGMGVVLIGVAVLPLLGIGGMSLYRAEAPGPTKDKLVPRISETARILWVIYLGLTLIGVVALWLGGMTFFDAVCHSMTAIATAGFSTHDTSFAETPSAWIRPTTTALMLVGGTSFAVLHRTLTHHLPWKESAELRTYVAIMLVATLVVAVDLGTSGTAESAGQALDHAAFQVASILTSTGYTTGDYDRWPDASRAILFALFFVGGMAGSTSGGVKVVRIVVLVRQSVSQFFQLIHPRGVQTIRLDGRPLDSAVLRGTSAFLGMWVLLTIVGTILFAATGLDLFTALSAAASTLGNVGPAFGGVGPAYTWEFLEPSAKLIASVWMILGRLELYTLLVILTPGFWRALLGN